jgi:hypothetical protein
MRRVFKTRYFSRWMRRTELTDSALCAAVAEMAKGLIDADLGGGVNRASHWFFVFGFEKNERANVSAKEVEAVQRIAADLFHLTSTELDAHVAKEALTEICHESED